MNLIGIAEPILLDTFCCAGCGAMGYKRAGFKVVGIDKDPQPNYPFEFIQADALDYLDKFGSRYDAIHASPPCQHYSSMTKRWGRQDEHPDLVAPVRELLKSIGRPYVIENVPGAPLIDPITLCGTMFGLQTKYGNQLRRHRLFEWSLDILVLTPPCRHLKASAIGVYGGGQHPDRKYPATIGVWGHAGGSSQRDGISQFGTAERREAMGVDWTTQDELFEGIPPAFTEFIGQYLRQAA